MPICTKTKPVNNDVCDGNAFKRPTKRKNMSEPKRTEFFVELAPGGPWLKNDLTCTPNWIERGLWPSIKEAETACAQSLQIKQNERD
jgi:hypothetical protein